MASFVQRPSMVLANDIGPNFMVKNTFLEVADTRPRTSSTFVDVPKRFSAPGILEGNDLLGPGRSSMVLPTPVVGNPITVTRAAPTLPAEAVQGRISISSPGSSLNLPGGALANGRPRIYSNVRTRCSSNMSEMSVATPRGTAYSYVPQTPENWSANAMPSFGAGMTAFALPSATPSQMQQVVYTQQVPYGMQGYPMQPMMTQQVIVQQQPQQRVIQAQGVQGVPQVRLSQLLPSGPTVVQQVVMPSMEASGAITTLMIRNIPNSLTREKLLEDLDVNGFSGIYDFFYLPIDFRTRNNLGYAFINLVTPEEATRLNSIYEGRQLDAFNSAKICEVVPAKVQGRDRNVEQYRNSAVMGMHEEYRPLMFENGVRVPFPEPTTKIKPVRLRPNRM